MGNMLQQIVAPLHDLGISHDPFIPVRLCTTLMDMSETEAHALL